MPVSLISRSGSDQHLAQSRLGIDNIIVCCAGNIDRDAVAFDIVAVGGTAYGGELILIAGVEGI